MSIVSVCITREGIKRGGLLRLRERRIRRELADADPARTLELQATLARILDAVEHIASAQAISR